MVVATERWIGLMRLERIAPAKACLSVARGVVMVEDSMLMGGWMSIGGFFLLL